MNEQTRPYFTKEGDKNAHQRCNFIQNNYNLKGLQVRLSIYITKKKVALKFIGICICNVLSERKKIYRESQKRFVILIWEF